NAVRPHERADLDGLKTGGAQALEKANLVIRGDDARFILKPVASPHLDHAHARRQTRKDRSRHGVQVSTPGAITAAASPTSVAREGRHRLRPRAPYRRRERRARWEHRQAPSSARKASSPPWSRGRRA